VRLRHNDEVGPTMILVLFETFTDILQLICNHLQIGFHNLQIIILAVELKKKNSSYSYGWQVKLNKKKRILTANKLGLFRL